MNPTYLVRFDDLCPTMNWTVWAEVEKMLLNLSIRPIAAVIPANQDVDLMVSAAHRDFWGEVRRWQALGWTIALHGFQHLHVTRDAGILIMIAIYRFDGFSRVVFFLDALFSAILLLGIRQSFSLLHHSFETLTSRTPDDRRVFVLGTSEPTELALSYLRSQRISCAGLIDTNGGTDRGRLVWGMPVIGALADLSRLATQHGVFEIVVPANVTQKLPYDDLLQSCDRARMRLLKLGLYPIETEDSVATDETALSIAPFGENEVADEVENDASVSTVS